MLPVILVSTDQKKREDYIFDFIKKNNVKPSFVFNIYPKGKEFSIEQIRDIKKQIIFVANEIQLFILHDFDRASLEAQNAFLKTLEDHSKNLQFMLAVSRHRHLLPTVISRSKLVVLSEDDNFLLDEKVKVELENFVSTGKLKILGSKNFQVKFRENSLEIFDDLLHFFRPKLSNDTNASHVLRKIINFRFLVEHNNADAQNAVDQILLFIRDLNQKASS